MSQQISNWQSQQLVTAAEMLLYSNDIYQRLGIMEPIQPFIVSGLEVSVNSSGLVTVTAGEAVSPNMNNSDNSQVPANGIQVIGGLVSQGTVQDTAGAADLGLIVLRQTLTPITSTPNFTITSTLTYIAGTATTYSNPGINDVVLCGIYYDGADYVLDFGKRSVSQQTYYQAIQGIDYFTNGSFYKWTFGNGPVTVGTSPVAVCDNWLAYTEAGTVTVQRYAMGSAERAIVPNSPLYAAQITRAAGGSLGDYDVIEQLLTPYWTLNGKVVTVSFWAKASASATLSAQVTVAYNPQGSSEIAIPYITQVKSIATDGVFRLYTFTIGINDLTDSLGTDDDNYIAVKLGFTSGTGTYTVYVAEAHTMGGSFYVQPQYVPGQDQGISIGTQEAGWWPVTNVGLGYIPLIEGSIGNAASSASIRAALDTAQLFTLLWNSTASNPAYAAVSGGRGSTAQADFAANKNITLLRNAGMVFGNAGASSDNQSIDTSTRAFGEPFGEEGHVQTLEELVPHVHDMQVVGSLAAPGSDGNFLGNDFRESESTGGGDAMNVMQPTTFVTHRIKL